MPQFDGTGPCGNGPKTGRGLGHCQKTTPPLCQKKMGLGFGCGQGQGKRRGCKLREEATPITNQEQLQKRIQELKNELALLEKKLTGLE